MIPSRSPVLRKSNKHFDILEDMGNLTLSSDSSSSSMSHLSQGVKTIDAPPKYAAIVPLVTTKRANHQPPTTFRKKVIIPDHPDPPLEQKQLDTRETPSKIKPAILNTDLSSLQSGKIPTSFKAQETFPWQGISAKDDANSEQHEEITRLKAQLEAATNEIDRQNRELVQQRITQNSIEQVLSSPSEANFPLDTTRLAFGPSYNASTFSDQSTNCSPVPFDRFEGPWGTGLPPASVNQGSLPHVGWNATITPPWANHEGRPSAGHYHRQMTGKPSQRTGNLRMDSLENEHPFFGAASNSAFEPGFRRTSIPLSRPGSSFNPYYNGLDPSLSTNSPELSPSITPAPFQGFTHTHFGQVPYQPRPVGTPLSATALEFNANSVPQDAYANANPWNVSPASETVSTYMAPIEPMNYRRLLDRNMSCDWKYIVDKIVCSNDQQASIFLQQKLKIATPDQKRELVDAIIAQAYPLMINRFGNFLVQRCLEHGTQDQVIAIANAIRGNTLSLSMDAFGCHVVQKAFDVVPEDFKAIMVHELLRRIPETVIHRYACHVWQKLFELRWSDSPPQIMKYVNEALRGMWHEVALGETGSLVVQNIFENCLEEDKRPCINEVLASLDVVAHGQFGNWCIQHICEHGAPADKSRAIEHVLHFATEYSTDQFASKVVEKCLKVGGPEFMERYLDRVCEGRPDRPRMPLIDISGDQYGNYLVQYILINANPHHREVVANHVRKHMVSLRGSKFGSRVAMLCCNPASATRPGPPIGMPMNNRFGPIGSSAGYPRPTPGPYR